MKHVTPNAFLISETRIDEDNFQSFLNEIGVPEWSTDADTDTEVVIETAGKLCYMSFDTSLNQNLTRTGTRNNYDYIQQGLISTKHGSVLEHGTVTLMLTNVSRVLTHELVRHRAGAAYSQTSGRYVRLDDLPFWVPSCIKENPELEKLFVDEILHQEETIKKMAEITKIDTLDFKAKKTLTSAFRRIIGNGLANNITATYNHRALRHVIEMRTSHHAEEEIRLLFNKVFELVGNRYPSIYGDAELTMIDGYNEIIFKHGKV
jgi:thymidylate synthase (FAD)